jgi:hypothetical protein
MHVAGGISQGGVGWHTLHRRWENHINRNNSTITDVFTGQLVRHPHPPPLAHAPSRELPSVYYLFGVASYREGSV